MSTSMSGSPLSPTNSESSSPTKRASRLNERIQRSRKHRQWAAQASAVTSVATNSTGSETVSSQQERVRNKLTKVAKTYQRHKKMHALSPTSPVDDSLSPKLNGSQTDAANANTSARLEQAVPFPDPMEDRSASHQKLMYAKDRVSRRVVVAWPDTETDDELPPESTPPTQKSPYTIPRGTSTPVTSKTWQKPKSSSQPNQGESFNTVSVDESPLPKGLSDEPTYKSVLELARSRFEKKPIDTHGPALAPGSGQRTDSTTKRQASWEKRDEKETDINASKAAWTTTPTHNYSSNRSDIGSAASSTGSATWKRPDVSSPHQNNLASWQHSKDPDHQHDVGTETMSDVSSSVISSGGRSGTWKRPEVQASSGNKLAPWQKPLEADVSDTPDAGKVPATPKLNTGKLSPWQKPRNDVSSLGVATNTSWQSPQARATPLKARSPIPHYDIARQGSWQKPSSPARPNVSTPVESGSVRPETPVQIWKRREQEMKTASLVKSEPRKLSYGQSEIHRGKGSSAAEYLSPNQQSQASAKHSLVRPPSSPNVGKVQSPPWVKPTSSGYQAKVAIRPQSETKQPVWATKQAASYESEAPDSPKQTYNARTITPTNDLQLSPSVPIDNVSEPVGDELMHSFGGAVIETPKSQSVAMLRASLGSKPAPPPFPSPAITAKSPGRSPWLAGNRSPGFRSDSPQLNGKSNGTFNGTSSGAPSLPTFAVTETTLVESTKTPVDQRSTISTTSTSTPSRMQRMTTTESDSEATPVTSHIDHRAIAIRATQLTVSPSKSLAEMAADSVLITDYSHLQDGTLSEYTDDEDSFVDSGIGMIMPSPSNLPNEFQTMAETPSDEAAQILAPKVSHSAQTDHYIHTPSQNLNSKDVDRRQDLHSRVKIHDDDENTMQPSQSHVTLNENVTPHESMSIESSSRNRPATVLDTTLDKSRAVCVPTENNDVVWSSSTVFGDPETWGAAGGHEFDGETPPVIDRARAISTWNGGSAKASRLGMDELDSIMDGTSFNEKPDKGSGDRVVKFFTFDDTQDDFTGEDETEWASRDPDIDAGLMRDESPSPEPEEFDEGVHEGFHEEEEEEEVSIYQNSSGIRTVDFAPDPNDEFYSGTISEGPDDEVEVLDPDQVFGTFWSAGEVEETFDFDGAGSSFFSSTTQDHDSSFATESPFRVILKAPPSAPSNRSRRQREASEDYDIRYASYLAQVEQWNEDPGKAEI